MFVTALPLVAQVSEDEQKETALVSYNNLDATLTGSILNYYATLTGSINDTSALF